MKKLLVILTIGTFTFACGEKKETTTNVAGTSQTAVSTSGEVASTETAALPPGHPAVAPGQQAAPAAAVPASAGSLTGTVVETMDAGGYTYLKVKTASGEQWAAVQQSKVKKGQNVTIAEQMTAEKFESKTLNRTFDRIVFGNLVGPQTASQQMPAGHPGMQGGGMNAMGTAQQHMSAPEIAAIKVPKAEGPDAKTIGEVWGSKAALADKPVVIRGKVVKSLSGIMGKNWLHLRDGSGSEGTDDITVTTNDRANVGDVVTIKGVLRVDKDFGAGYRYAVIVEDATVTK